VTPACQLVVSDHLGQCTRDEDCPTSVPNLVCVDALCVEHDGGSTSEVGSESTGIDATCEPTTECAPTAPAGWRGPVIAIARQREPAACPDSAPTVVATGHAGLQADAAVCTCNCTPTEMGCGVTISTGFGGCAKHFSASVEEDVCEPFYLVPFSTEAVLPAKFDGCVREFSEEIPAREWESHVRLCTASAAECGGGLCMPIPDPLSGEATCVWLEGDHSCPDPAYAERFVFHGGASDDRRCTECTCGERSRCKLQIHADSACGDDPYEIYLDEPQCVPLSDFGTSGDANLGAFVSRVQTSTGPCERVGGIPTGEAREVDTFTVCCRS
jgi:hypothetical protein